MAKKSRGGGGLMSRIRSAFGGKRTAKKAPSNRGRTASTSFKSKRAGTKQAANMMSRLAGLRGPKAGPAAKSMGAGGSS